MEPTFFETPEELRRWFAENHETETELHVGYYKKGSGRPSITWPESVDQALCYGWIDGVRNSIDDVSYRIRFTPRKKTSIWSAVNVARVAELTEQGLMQPAGLRAFANRKEDKTAIYSHEVGDRQFDEADERLFRQNQAAWDYFQAQAPSYRKAAIVWVMSAKKAETREKRLASLIENSAEGKWMTHLTPPNKRK